MRCPYCQQNIRVQGRFCPKCGEQIFGLPVSQQRPSTSTPAQTPPAAPPASQPPPPPPYRPFGSGNTAGSDDDLITFEEDSAPAAVPAAGGEPTGLHAAAGEDIGKTCPYCRFPLKPGEQVMTCPACKLPHHADCWRENQGCTTYGCQGTAAATPSPATPPVLRPTAAGPAPTHVGMPDFGALQQTEFAGRANNALVLAILGAFCCAPLALIGLFMGISILADLKRTNTMSPSANGKAVAAIVVGVVGTLGWLIWLISMAARQSG